MGILYLRWQHGTKAVVRTLSEAATRGYILSAIVLLIACGQSSSRSIWEEKGWKALNAEDYAEAEKYFAISFKELEREDGTAQDFGDSLSRHLRGFSEVYKRQRRQVDVLPYVRKTVDIAKNKSRDKHDFGPVFGMAISLYLELGRCDEADPLIDRVLLTTDQDPKERMESDFLRAAKANCRTPGAGAKYLKTLGYDVGPDGTVKGRPATHEQLLR